MASTGTCSVNEPVDSRTFVDSLPANIEQRQPDEAGSQPQRQPYTLLPWHTDYTKQLRQAVAKPAEPAGTPQLYICRFHSRRNNATLGLFRRTDVTFARKASLRL